ncbi:ATP-binding protein [Paenibacillus sp. NFR01]|uniref:ATP-binding protein n=1 Tax=Paenibacillus sp. NFR01 TaxID=1566279 RepID=UPI0008AC19EA|nr:ATP-binding protein [Paenibacillus sp. NFR01]SET46144.1 serine/threonine-protein kinase RsbW [Paenibacillus sp. NFR01]
MGEVQKEVLLFGMEGALAVIDRIISELQLEDYAFDIRLILMEAVTNAYYHGNLGNATKPIYIRYSLRDRLLRLQVEDCGCSIGFTIPEDIERDRLLDDSGRGLFLIRCYSDHVEMQGNTMIISKNVGPIFSVQDDVSFNAKERTI